MKRTTIRARRATALDEDELNKLSDLSFVGVMDDVAQSERRDFRQPKTSRPAPSKPSRPERDLDATHTDRTINEMLAGAFESGDEPDPSSNLRTLPGGTMEPETEDKTEDLLSPDLLFPELTLK
jgi:hypothetical protein